MVMKTTMKLVMVYDRPRTWVEVSVDIPDEVVKRKYLKLKEQRDRKDAAGFIRFTGKDQELKRRLLE